MAPLLAAGLSFLPQIPKMWGAVAGIFGKKPPATVEAAGKLAGEVADLVKGGQTTSEQDIMLQTAIMENKEVILQKQNDRAEIERQGRQDEMNATVQLMAQGINSQDPYVARTRPKILRDLFSSCVIYSITCIALIANMAIWGVKKDVLDQVIEIMKYFGAFQWGTFATAFVGYTTARTVDKKNPQIKEQGNMVGKLLKQIL